MARKAAAPERDSKWASIRLRLGDILESQAPHVRQNLATLAGIVADDPAAVDELAVIAGDALDRVARRQGHSEQEVARTALEERAKLDPAKRERFDAKLKETLSRRCSQWDPLGPAVDAVIRLGLPASAIPEQAFARAIIQEAGRYPLDERGDAALRADIRDRLRNFAEADREALDEWRLGVREELRSLIAALGETQEDRPILFVLLRTWPALLRATEGFPAVTSPKSLHRAAMQGQGPVLRRLGWAVLGAAVASGWLVLLLLASHRAKSLPLSDIGDDALGNFIVLGGIASAVALLVSFAYVPTLGRRLPPLLLLINLVFPAAAGAIAATFAVALFPEFFDVGDRGWAKVPQVLAAIFLALIAVAATVYGLTLQLPKNFREWRGGWHVLVAAGPSVFLCVTLGTVGYFLGWASTGLLIATVPFAVATASAIWTMEGRSLPSLAGPAEESRARFYAGASIVAAGTALAMISAIPLLVFLTPKPETIVIDASELGREPLEVTVTDGIPVRIRTSNNAPVRYQRRGSLSVGSRSLEWKPANDYSTFMSVDGEAFADEELPILKSGEFVCASCNKYPSFTQLMDTVFGPAKHRPPKTSTLKLYSLEGPIPEKPEEPLKPQTVAAESL